MEEYQILQHPLRVEEEGAKAGESTRSGAGKRWEGEREKETCSGFRYSSKSMSENFYARS
jgi:hypothetical protein